MPNESQEMKIELLTETIEALVLATVAATIPSPDDGNERRAKHQNVVDARATLAKALATCLAPALRIVSRDAPKGAPPSFLSGRDGRTNLA
jgi:hypothetical protein